MKKYKVKGSLTIEATMAVMITILVLMGTLLLFPIIKKELVAYQKLYEICNHGRLLSGIDSNLVQPYVMGEAALREMKVIAYEKEGGVLCKSYITTSLPFGVFVRDMNTYQALYIRNWQGYTRCKEKENYVYITRNGTVYHTTMACYHLQRMIKEVTKERINSYRNQQGGKYYPCERCGKEEESQKKVVYITLDGTRYHSTRECSSLLRYIERVPLSTVEKTYPPCKNCGNNEGEFENENRGNNEDTSIYSPSNR